MRGLPAFMEASACAMFLAIEASRAIPCSAAATVFAVGALTTRHPLSVAAWRSTLSIPTPALPTTLRRPLEASNTSRVTFVPLRTISASQREILEQRSWGERLYEQSTLANSRSSASPASPSFSATRMVGRAAASIRSPLAALRAWGAGILELVARRRRRRRSRPKKGDREREERKQTAGEEKEVRGRWSGVVAERWRKALPAAVTEAMASSASTRERKRSF
ncbi:hypothetical protein MUK42_35645 [Musa troglodytarum]|uniref:Uncharacterized protein n=1 Tax=Musa troglodytarum TaxID=320322 RepID=A0A9E7HTC6_9LILI|nr:hypothetical protein MUK42_35645 [Musa troglodytarum]